MVIESGVCGFNKAIYFSAKIEKLSIDDPTQMCIKSNLIYTKEINNGTLNMVLLLCFGANIAY